MASFRRKESRVTEGRPRNRRQHQGAEWGHTAWRLLLLEEQRWGVQLTNHSKARNPSTWNAVLSQSMLQELQRTCKSAGGSEIQLSSLWGRLWKGGPGRCYWQWTHGIKEQEPGRWGSLPALTECTHGAGPWVWSQDRQAISYSKLNRTDTQIFRLRQNTYLKIFLN